MSIPQEPTKELLDSRWREPWDLVAQGISKHLVLVFVCVCVCVLLACTSMCHVRAWCLKKEKKAFYSLELELQRVSSHHMGAGN